jgi:GTPase SAR1 family protein
MTFDPYRVARVLKLRFCYNHLTHSGSVNRYKEVKIETSKPKKFILQCINTQYAQLYDSFYTQPNGIKFCFK